MRRLIHDRVSYTAMEDLKQKAQLLLASSMTPAEVLMRVHPTTVLGLLETIADLEEALEGVDAEIEAAVADERRESELEIEALNQEIKDLNAVLEMEHLTGGTGA